MTALKDWWKELDAKRRQLIFVGTFVVVGFSCLFLVMDNSGKEPDSDPNSARVVAARDVVTQSFTGANTRNMDMHGMAAQMKEMDRTIRSINIKFDNMARRVEGREKAQQEAVSRAVQDAKGNLANQTMGLLEKKYGKPFGDISRMNEELKEVLEEAALATERALAAADKPGTTTPLKQKIPTPAAEYKTTHKVDWKQEHIKTKEVIADEVSLDSPATNVKLGIVVNERRADEEESEKESFVLPGNTIFHGVLLTGAVVPVGKDSKENPVPILLRIKDDAILANNFSADIKECFLSASGTGDLSSERVEFRSERLVCIREDGGVLETPIEMWSVGEDGMAGVQGKMVHRAGSLVAQATLAAVVDGFAQMFAMVPVPTLNTTDTSQTVYQQALSSDSLQAASVQGLSGGLTRLTDYLMDLADEILPVLEIHALREIGFVMVKGQKLEFTETVSPSRLTSSF